MSFSGIDAVEPVGDQRARRMVQLGGKLDAGRAGADDGDVELIGAHRARLRMRAQAGVHEPPMEALGVGGVSSAIACSFTPGVPKSLVRLPTAITSVS